MLSITFPRTATHTMHASTVAHQALVKTGDPHRVRSITILKTATAVAMKNDADSICFSSY